MFTKVSLGNANYTVYFDMTLIRSIFAKKIFFTWNEHNKRKTF